MRMDVEATVQGIPCVKEVGKTRKDIIFYGKIYMRIDINATGRGIPHGKRVGKTRMDIILYGKIYRDVN